jgi:hypothetical protein
MVYISCEYDILVYLSMYKLTKFIKKSKKYILVFLSYFNHIKLLSLNLLYFNYKKIIF